MKIFNWFLKQRYVAKTIVFFRYMYLRIRYPQSAVYDVQDPRDWKAEEKLKAIKIKLPDYVDNFEKTKQKPTNQGQEPACTAIGTTLMKRIADAFEHGRLILHDWEWLWDKQGRPPEGDWLHRSLQVSVDNPFETEGKLWSWSGYATVKDKTDVSPEGIKTMKKWLARGHSIKTGISIKEGLFVADGTTFRDNMELAGHTGILRLDNGRSIGGHDLTICGYDEKGKDTGTPGWIIYTCWGSWGKWKTGKMILPFDQTYRLYSTYIAFDTIDLK
jgi:hypothetical protein